MIQDRTTPSDHSGECHDSREGLRPGEARGAAARRGQGDPFPTGAFQPVFPDGTCGDIPMRIDREGVWHYKGSPIQRKEMVCLFASVLRRGEDGAFWLVTPVEAGRIEVEDAPFMAVEMFVSSAGEEQVLSFRTNVDEIVTADDRHPIRVDHDAETGEPSPYVSVRPGLDARLTRAVYYDLVARGMERRDAEGTRYGVWSSGTFFPLGSLDDESPETAAD